MNRIMCAPLALILVCLFSYAHGQPRFTSTEELPLTESGAWGYARFSPDGSKVYYSTLSYDGIWEFDRSSRKSRQVTEDKGAGFGFSIAPDGFSMAHRSTKRGARWTDKTQEIVVTNLRDGTTQTLASARTLSPPAFHDASVSFIIGDDIQPAPPKKQGTFLEGVVNQKIVVVVNGERRVLDPLGNGSYIWPALSPDRASVVAYDMDNGAFIASVDGTLRQRLGKADAPVWTRDGGWIVYFTEENDGYRITGADLHAVRPDGTARTRLTDTRDRVELFPSCSPTANEIVCHTLDGKLLIMTYTVTP